MHTRRAPFGRLLKLHFSRLRHSIASRILRLILGSICKIDIREFANALLRVKPLIIVINHINFLEAPILLSYGYPHRVTGVAKSETWKNPLFSFLCNTYKAIPIKRTGPYNDSFRRVREAIEKGFYVCLAPEGTRSKNGILGPAKAGIIQLAFYTGAAILPVAHFGGEHIWKNLRRLKRTPVRFRAGNPFRIKFAEKSPGRLVREEMLMEVMGQIARLLPPEMRGEYAAQAEAQCRHLEFLA
jgi:1-acyl-sn-glycerol-3-phosphate acyltransferase